MDLVQLVYVSAATKLLTDEELDQILESSVRHNTQNGVTGLLLYTKGNFMQVLEGTESAVSETYARICKDTLHTHIILILKEAIEVREFSAWAMGYRRLSAIDLEKHPEQGHLFANGFDAKVLASDGTALSLLKSFYGLNNG